MRLTNDELYRLIDEKRDTVDFPYFSQEMLTPIFNSEYISYVDKISRLPESEPQRARIAPLISMSELPGSRDIQGSVLNRAMKVLSVAADYSFECRGETRIITRPVTPLTSDAYGVALDDPNSSPEDHFPSYIENSRGSGRVIRILSRSQPIKIYLTYIKYPEPVDFMNDPGGYMEVDRLAQEEIVSQLVSLLSAIIPDGRYQAFKNEENT